MVIDFHVHTFPDKIAERALASLSEKSGTKYYLNGTVAALRTSMETAGIEASVLLPVATNEKQYRTINETAYRINEHTEETGILSFGGIHPKNENYREILRDLKNHGVKGIKLHPVYQEQDFDGIETMRIVECACENDLIIVIHAGYDVGFPGKRHAAPVHILPVIERLQPKKLVLAHMGGWDCWDEVEEALAGQDVYFDTSFSITPIRDRGESSFAINETRTANEQL
ncbi:MAG: amidohydrolase family protein, partial [Lachnospiraceae bacterium]|nr:amidohydrolase family protein [Lachnospiraceae bacterium]